jgi:transposase
MVRANAPSEAPAPVQYGPRFRAALVYLRNYQLLPYNRLAQLCSDLFGAAVSKRTIEAAQQQACEALAPFDQEVRKQLLQEEVLHADETGMRVDGKRQWFHSLSTPLLTLCQAHPKRGGEAIEDNGVIPAFKGTLVHDCWSPYFRYGDKHGLCGAHLLRELEGISENDGYGWACELFVLLEMMAKTTGTRGDQALSESLIAWFEQVYDTILLQGEQDLPPPQRTPGKRGRAKKSKAANLHARLVTHRDSVLRFLRNPAVPFTNNLAERDIRMAKLREKISGCSRTFTGAEQFARIRSYVSTSLKQDKDLFQNIKNAILGKPWIPVSGCSQS